MRSVPLRFLLGWKSTAMLLYPLGNTRLKHKLLLIHTCHFNHYIPLFCLLMHQRNGTEHKRRLFVSGGNNCKCVLSETELLFSDQMSHRIVSNKVDLRDYWRLSISLLHRSISSIPPLNLISYIYKTKCFARKFSFSFNLDSSGISLHDFSLIICNHL